MIHKHIKEHGTYHSGLVLFLTLGILLAYYLRENKDHELLLLSVMTVIYIIWGVVHHGFMHTLTKKIVIEYIAMALFGLTIAVFTIKGFIL